MKKQILAILTILAVIAVLAVNAIPSVAASQVTAMHYASVSNGAYIASDYGMSYYQTFTAGVTGYLEEINLLFCKTGTPGNVHVFVAIMSATSASSQPTSLLETSSLIIHGSDLTISYTEYTFPFQLTTLITSGQYYAIRVWSNNTDNASHRIYCGGSMSGNAYTAGGLGRYYVLQDGGYPADSYRDISTLNSGNNDFWFIAVVNAAGPTPTIPVGWYWNGTAWTTPSPAPTYSGNYWDNNANGTNTNAWGINWINTTLPFFVPLVLVFVCGFIGYKFAGPWGFFAGMNLGIFIGYAIFPTQIGLWVVLSMIIVDAIMLLGKVGFNRKE